MSLGGLESCHLRNMARMIDFLDWSLTTAVSFACPFNLYTTTGKARLGTYKVLAIAMDVSSRRRSGWETRLVTVPLDVTGWYRKRIPGDLCCHSITFSIEIRANSERKVPSGSESRYGSKCLAKAFLVLNGMSQKV